MIRTVCVRCKAVLNDPDEAAGKSATCSTCGHTYKVPVPRSASGPNTKLIVSVIVAVLAFGIVSVLLVSMNSEAPDPKQKARVKEERREKIREERSEERRKQAEKEAVRERETRNEAGADIDMREHERELKQAREKARLADPDYRGPGDPPPGVEETPAP